MTQGGRYIQEFKNRVTTSKSWVYCQKLSVVNTFAASWKQKPSEISRRISNTTRESSLTYWDWYETKKSENCSWSIRKQSEELRSLKLLQPIQLHTAWRSKSICRKLTLFSKLPCSLIFSGSWSEHWSTQQSQSLQTT